MAPLATTAQSLEVLAHRVARNREIAGVHYNMDSRAGQCAALLCASKLFALPAGGLLRTLIGLANVELANLP